MKLLDITMQFVADGFGRRWRDFAPLTYVYFLRMCFTDQLSISKMRGELIRGASAVAKFGKKILPGTRDDLILLIEYYYSLYEYCQVTGRAVNYDS